MSEVRIVPVERRNLPRRTVYTSHITRSDYYFHYGIAIISTEQQELDGSWVETDRNEIEWMQLHKFDDFGDR